jgi:hypothetical protein
MPETPNPNPAAAESKQHTCCTQYACDHPFEFWSITFQLLLVVVTAIYSIFAWGQWGVMQDSLRLAQGAKLVVTKVEIGDIAGTAGFTMTVSIRNVGRSEALNVSPLLATCLVAKRHARPEFDAPDFDLGPSAEEIAPKQPQEFTQDCSALTADEIRRVTEREGDSWLYIYGLLRYQDQFGLICRSFCRVYVSRDRMASAGLFKRPPEDAYAMGGCDYPVYEGACREPSEASMELRARSATPY